jgi:hypothetical protein
VLRVFRIFKPAEYLHESRTLAQALRASGRKIFVFLLTVVTIVVVVGALMYVIEGEEHGFTNIPLSIYWAVVTLTTVGYGDLAPATTAGRALAAVLMLTVRYHRGADRDRDCRADPGRLPSGLDSSVPGMRRRGTRAGRGVLPALWGQTISR